MTNFRMFIPGRKIVVSDEEGTLIDWNNLTAEEAHLCVEFVPSEQGRGKFIAPGYGLEVEPNGWFAGDVQCFDVIGKM